MRNGMNFFYALLVLGLFTSGLSGESMLVPFKEKDEIILFDADRNDVKDFVNYKSSWIQGSNTIPQLSLVEKSDGKWIKFSYSGSGGKGISKLNIDHNVLRRMLPEGTEACGVKLLIAYEGAEFEKIGVTATFADSDNYEACLIPLESKIKEYSTTDCLKFYNKKLGSFCDWSKFKSLCIASDKNDISFMLKRISLITRKSEGEEVSLDISSVKPAQEILPAGTEILNGVTINEDCLKNAVALPDFYLVNEKREIESGKSHFRTKLAYDKNNLCIETEADFPQKPVSLMKKQDEDVYQDDAVEYFFSSWNDNDKKIQFVMNYEGIVFDALKDYDLTAAAVVNSVGWNLPHIKRISYVDGVWRTLLAVSLEDLKMDLTKCRFMGFQIYQSFKDRMRNLSWAQYPSKLPDPLGFGVLVFNKKTFGTGTLEIKEIRSREKRNVIDLTINFSEKSFADGEYKVEAIIVAPDFSSIKKEEKIKFFYKETDIALKIDSVKNLNGIYTVYICVYNRNNDMKIGAANFENRTPLKDIFGENILWPTPKTVIWGNGVFMAGKVDKIKVPGNASERTVKTANIFKNKLYGFTGSTYSISRSAELQNTISLKISKEAVFDGKKVELRPEGYCIDVRTDGVDIAGADEPGLYYGCITFMQLLKMPMQIVDGIPAKCVKILDWPDVSNRAVRIEHPWYFKGRTFKEQPKVEDLMNWVERFVAENKFNIVGLDVSTITRFERQPEFNGPERFLSLDDLKRYGEFCSDHFLKTEAHFQLGGHSGLFVLAYHPELVEKGYPNQADVTHPDHNKIVFNCMQDVIDSMKPESLALKTDEWWHGKSTKEFPDETLRGGKTRAEAFLDFHLAVYDFLKERNIGIQIFEDMLDPRHNGKRYDVYKVIDKIPKDIIIRPWTGGAPDVPANYFLNKGFKVWGSPTHYWAYGKDVRNKIDGMGTCTYTLGTDWKLYRSTVEYSVYEIFMGADDAWNLRSKDPDIMSELACGKLSAVREMFAMKPNPLASSKITPVDIQGCMNSSAAEYFCKKNQECAVPSGTVNVGNIPMAFAVPQMNCVLLGGDKAMSLPLDKTCSSLIFLQTVAPVDEKAVETFNMQPHWRNWPYGYVTGNYHIHYDDGTLEKVPVRLYWNIGLADIHLLYRNTNDNRYVMPLKTSDGGYRFLYQYEWVNPYPDKKIEKITYLDNGEFNFNILLFALSYRERK